MFLLLHILQKNETFILNLSWCFFPMSFVERTARESAYVKIGKPALGGNNMEVHLLQYCSKKIQICYNYSVATPRISREDQRFRFDGFIKHDYQIVLAAKDSREKFALKSRSVTKHGPQNAYFHCRVHYLFCAIFSVVYNRVKVPGWRWGTKRLNLLHSDSSQWLLWATLTLCFFLSFFCQFNSIAAIQKQITFK